MKSNKKPRTFALWFWSAITFIGMFALCAVAVLHNRSFVAVSVVMFGMALILYAWESYN